MRRLGRQLRRFRRSLWYRPAAYALSAVLAVVYCWVVQQIGLPFSVPTVSQGLVTTLLSIITTSMLTVTTFTIGTLVTAYHSAATSGTPRAFQLVIADGTSQEAASSFIGAFIFGVVATVGVEMDVFGNDGLAMIAVLTAGILIWVIGTFIVWIDSVARLGQVGTSVEKAEAAAEEALRRVSASPYLGGRRGSADDVVVNGTTFGSPMFGYLERVDMERLEQLGREHDATIRLAVRPGALVAPSSPVAAVCFGEDRDNERDDDRDDDDRAGVIEEAVAAFEISDERNFDSDPAFSLVVLGEIGAKALSPGVNDPGTAMTVVNAVTRQVAHWCQRGSHEQEPEFPHVYVPPLDTNTLIRSGYDLVARYGCGDADVVGQLITALSYLATITDDRLAVDEYARSVLATARSSLNTGEFAQIERRCPPEWVS